MFKYLAALAAVSAALILPTVAGAQTTYIRNISTVVSSADIQAQMPVFQSAFTQDFDPAWGTGTKLVFSPFPPAKATVLTIVDSDVNAPGALGYHGVAKGVIPYGVALAKTVQDGGYSLSVTITHELFEMAVNPFLNDAVRVNRAAYPFYLQETADPVESDQYAYTRSGVLISDFILPRWFRAGSVGPWDFTRHTTRALQILHGGYQIVWSRNAQSWTKLCATGESCRARR